MDLQEKGYQGFDGKGREGKKKAKKRKNRRWVAHQKKTKGKRPIKTHFRWGVMKEEGEIRMYKI